MKIQLFNNNGKEGAGLLTVMMALMVILFTSGAVIAMTTAMPRMVRRQCDFIRAKAIAEAGINEAYSRLSADFSLRHSADAFPLTSFAGGSYRVTVQPIDDHSVILVSVGDFGSSRTHTSVELGREDLVSGGFGPTSPWGQAIFANGNLQFHGSPPFIIGHFHTNQTFAVSGSLGDGIQGTVTAQQYSGSANDLPPEQKGDWKEIPFPQLTDQEFVDLYQQAMANGAVLSGGAYRTSNIAGINGDVLWFTGDVTFPGDFEFSGYVIVAGNVTFRGSGDRSIDGLLYVQGNVTCNGATDLTLDGAMLVGGSVTFNGASSAFSYVESTPPGVDPDSEDLVTVSAWRD